MKKSFSYICLASAFLASVLVSCSKAMASLSSTGTIAFVRSDEKGQNPNVWVVAADGSGQAQVTTDNDSSYPCWLSDGQIIFGRAQKKHPNYAGNFPTEIWSIKPDGSEPKLVLKSDTYIKDLACSPGEPMITYAQADKAKGWDIYLQKIGGGVTQLTHAPSDYYATPSFSPDNKRILFAKMYSQDPADDLHTALFSMGTLGQDEKLLLDDPMDYYTGPVLSPANDRLAFWRSSSRNVDFGDRQYAMLAETDGTRYYIYSAGFGYENDKYEVWDQSDPDWSPDSQSLVFTVIARKTRPTASLNDAPPEYSIWIGPVGGGPAKKLVDNGQKPKWYQGSVTTKTAESPTSSSVSNSVAPAQTEKPKPTTTEAAEAATVGVVATAAYALVAKAAVESSGSSLSRLKLAVFGILTFLVASAAALAIISKIQTG